MKSNPSFAPQQGEDSSQKAIDSYNNYDLKETASVGGSKVAKPSKSTDEDSLNTEDDSNSHFISKDATEDHGNFISNDDEFLDTKGKKNAAVPVLITAQRESEEEDGCIHSEFTGHDGATSEVFEEYKEYSFVMDEVQYNDEYKDCTYDSCVSALY